jgi:cytoskeleton protein RodZ
MGLSLRDVHSLTAIPINCIAALEEGELSQLPSPVYARGYIRSYAEAVRLDGDRLALDLWRGMEEARVTPSGGSAAVGQRPPSRSLATAAGPPAGAALRQRHRTNGRSPSTLAPLRQPASPWVPKPSRLQRMAPALERVGIVLLLIVLGVGIWDLQRSRPVHTPKEPAQIAAGISQTHDSSPAIPPSITSNAPAAAGTATLTTTPVSDNGSLATYVTGAGRYSVQLQATDAPCWVQVRAGSGGAVLFQGTLQPGQIQPFDATGTLWVRVGNLGHASVQVNGTPLVLPNKPSFPYNVLLQA